MKNLFISVSSFFLSLLVLNASAIEADNPVGEISGKIIDQKSNEPVSFASVALITEKDSSLVSGIISNDAGEFKFDNIPYGKYQLKINYLGYESITIKDLNVSQKINKLKLNEVQLTPDIKTLKEVTLTKERLKGEEKIDRTVFTINDNIRKMSSSGIDILKHVPSVSVDFQENVTVEGQSDFQFYVDGVLRNKDFVAQLDAQNIDKIEIVSNPGSKYDADISAIINIVTKKNKRSGINGSVTLPVSHPKKAVLNSKGNLEYGNQNFRIYIGDRFHHEHFNGGQNTDTRLEAPYLNPYTFSKKSEGKNTWQQNYMNYGIDWLASEKTSINFLGEWRQSKGFSDDYESLALMSNSSGIIDKTVSFQDNKNTGNSYFFSGFIKQKLAREGDEFSAEISYHKETGKVSNVYKDIYYDPENINSILDTIYRSDITNNLRNALELKGDYSFNIGSVKNEIGVKVTELFMDNHFSDGNWLEIGEMTNENFGYIENRSAAYYNLTSNIKQFGIQAGLRAEYTSIDMDTIQPAYYNLLPAFSLNRSFKKGHNLKLSFRRKLRRPNIQDLNPFEIWSDSLHVQKGNPNLRPAIENRLEFTYSKNFGSNYLSPKVYVRYMQDGRNDISKINSEGVTEITRANIGKEWEYGLSVNGAFQLFEIWNIKLNSALYYRTVESKLNLAITDKAEKLSYRIGGSSSVQLPKDFSLLIFMNYNSPRISYQRIKSRDLLCLVGAEKQFSKKAKLSLIYNPFIKDFTYNKIITDAPSYHEEWYGYLDVKNIFMIEFTYNFSYGGKVNKINRSVEYERSNNGGSF